MVEHRTVNARVAGSSPAFRAMKGTWYRGSAPDSKSGYVGSNPAVPANSGCEAQRYAEEGKEL